MRANSVNISFLKQVTKFTIPREETVIFPHKISGTSQVEDSVICRRDLTTFMFLFHLNNGKIVPIEQNLTQPGRLETFVGRNFRWYERKCFLRKFAITMLIVSCY